jgi:Flp pilus assembly pilin Flp
MTRRPSTANRLGAFARRLAHARRGSSSVEYGFILAFIVLVAFVAIVQLADVTKRMWNDNSDRVIAASSNG